MTIHGTLDDREKEVSKSLSWLKQTLCRKTYLQKENKKLKEKLAQATDLIDEARICVSICSERGLHSGKSKAQHQKWYLRAVKFNG